MLARIDEDRERSAMVRPTLRLLQLPRQRIGPRLGLDHEIRRNRPIAAGEAADCERFGNGFGRHPAGIGNARRPARRMEAAICAGNTAGDAAAGDEIDPSQQLDAEVAVDVGNPAPSCAVADDQLPLSRGLESQQLVFKAELLKKFAGNRKRKRNADLAPVPINPPLRLADRLRRRFGKNGSNHDAISGVLSRRRAARP